MWAGIPVDNSRPDNTARVYQSSLSDSLSRAQACLVASKRCRSRSPLCAGSVLVQVSFAAQKMALTKRQFGPHAIIEELRLMGYEGAARASLIACNGVTITGAGYRICTCDELIGDPCFLQPALSALGQIDCLQTASRIQTLQGFHL